MEKKFAREWKILIEPALKSKESEFKMIGYQDVTAANIWSCLEKQVWKGNPEKRLHEIIQDVFRLQANTYMNYIRIDALHVGKDDLMLSINALTESDGN